MIKRIAQITDLHLDEIFPFNNHISARKRFDTILEDIEQKKIDTIVCTGDIGENKGISYFFQKLKYKNVRITLGNHDEFNKLSKYTNLKTYHSNQKEHFKFLYLDSSQGIIDTQQFVWLEQELISSTPIIIFMHHPVIGLNAKVDAIGKLKNRAEILNLLASFTTKKVIIYCGHYHLESLLIHKNIEQYITPAVSFQIKKNKSTIEIDTTSFGYRIIEFKHNKVSSKIIRFSHAD